MKLEYKNYKLRKPENRDANGLVEITHDKEAMKYYGTLSAFFENEKDALKEINWMTEQFLNNAGRWIIIDKQNDLYIGDIGIHNYNKDHKKVEIGYKLKREFWGKGIITNLIKILINYAFNNFDFNRIEALVDVRNIGSKKVLINNNLKLAGVLR